MKKRRLRVGVLTSGGDAPGMNAVIRAVVRSALHFNMRIYGIRGGFEGLFRADMYEMESQDVSDIIHRGGTILRTDRCQEMRTPEGQQRAANYLQAVQMDAVIVIGGDGSFKGAQALANQGIKVVCIPATIDLDMHCTEYTIGFDTAVNTATNAMSCLRDTSSSHDRCGIVEVMGRNAGHLALWCAIASGADEVSTPENPLNISAVLEQITINRAKGKRHHLVVVAEGVGNANQLAEELENLQDEEARATILGHMQRGGTPTAMDRMQGSVMGFKAVEAIHNGQFNKAIVFQKGEHALMDLDQAIETTQSHSTQLYDLTKILAI